MDIILNFLLLLCLLALVAIVAWPIYEFALSIYHSTLRYDTDPDIAVVSDKRYQAAYTTTTMMYVGKTFIPQTHFYDEEYNVDLTYEQEPHTFNNKELYDSVNIGDQVNVLIHRGYNNHDELKHVYLSIND